MVDLAAISGAFGAVKSAADGAKLLLNVHEQGAIRTAVAGLQTQLATALTAIIDARLAQADMLDRTKELEAQIAEMKRWDGEAATYELQEIGPGSLAYGVSAPASFMGPPHYLCATCYDKRQKSVLQAALETFQGRRVYGCPTCKTKIVASR